MNILIIGGTRFLGRHLVDSATRRGHTLTLFNRGQSNPGLYPDLETIPGDRAADLHKLAGRSWDAVIDTCGYLPRIVSLSANALKDRVGRYVFISSISVYSDISEIGITEDSPLGTMPDETVEEITGETYGPLKVLCEKAVASTYNERALIVRPGLIIGPHDPTDRFTYWPVRVARGGAVLAPESPDVPVQVIDGRDLAEFTIHLLEQQQASGAYNATGPAQPIPFGEMLNACKQDSNSNATFHWGSVEFLEQNNVAPWSDMPVWIPNTTENAGFSRVSIQKAISAGLTFRSLVQTIRDTLAWAATRPEDYAWRAGLSADREKELLEKLGVS